MIYADKQNNQIIIYVEGNLDNVENIKSVIKSEIKNCSSKEIILDLAKLNFVSDECLKELKNLQFEYNIKFKNYSSFYTEMRLNEYQLL
jgi:anti-anti-sigma regulatory factor